MQIINDVKSRLDDLIRNGFYVSIEKYINKAISIFKAAPELFLLYTVVYLILMPIGGFFFSGPLTAGFYIVARRIDQGKAVGFENFFDGFNTFLPLFLLPVISGLFIFIGTLAFVIPGIYLSVAYTFSIFFIIFFNMDFFEAMEASRKLVTREWLNIFVLIIVIGLINLLGLIVFGIGIIITFPISQIMLYAAFDDIFGSQ